MNDVRWTIFGFVNYLLLAFYLFVLLFTFSVTGNHSEMGIPFWFEIILLCTPLAGIVNCLFNLSVIRNNYRAQSPLSSRKKNWQWFIIVLHIAAFGFLIYQLTQIISIAGEEKNQSGNSLLLFWVILLVYGILGVYITIFQLAVARHAGMDPVAGNNGED